MDGFVLLNGNLLPKASPNFRTFWGVSESFLGFAPYLDNIGGNYRREQKKKLRILQLFRCDIGGFFGISVNFSDERGHLPIDFSGNAEYDLACEGKSIF